MAQGGSTSTAGQASRYGEQSRTGADDPVEPGDQPGSGAAGRCEAPGDEATLARRLGHHFDRPALLSQALAHRSWCSEAGGSASNERLEFLGDAVLGMVVADHCYERYPELPEGALAKIRAAVVNTAVLADVGSELGVGAYLYLGRGEDASGGREKPSILANTVEALIGAVYLDGGWPAASRLVLGLLDGRIVEAAAGPGAEDFKTRLQEVVVHRSGGHPRYDVHGTGPDHARSYTATVWISGQQLGEGAGRSKKDAEQAAARMAWDRLANDAAGHTGPAGAAPDPAGSADPAGAAPDSGGAAGPAGTAGPAGDRHA